MTECEHCGHYAPNAGYTTTCTHCGAPLPPVTEWHERPVYVAPNLDKAKCLECRDLCTEIMEIMQDFFSGYPEELGDSMRDLYDFLKAEAEEYDERANS